MTDTHFHSKFREAANTPAFENPVYKLEYVKTLESDAYVAAAVTGLPILTRYTVEEEGIEIEYLVGKMVEVK